MRTVELILAAILSFIIIVDYTYPEIITRQIKSPLGVIALMGLVLYLFTKSTVLGVLALIAGFSILQRGGSFPKYSTASNRPVVSYNNDPAMSRGVTLEETMVSNIIPVRYVTTQMSFKNDFTNVGNAADAV